MTQVNGQKSPSKGSPDVIKLSRILKDYRESGAVNRLVGVLEAVDDRVFLTKSGDLLVMLATPGIDYECRDAAAHAASRGLNENFWPATEACTMRPPFAIVKIAMPL